MASHEGTASLAANHKAFSAHFVECLAHRARANTKSGCNLRFARQHLTGRPAAVTQPLHQKLFDLPVEWPIAERDRRRASGRNARLRRFLGLLSGDAHLKYLIRESAASQPSPFTGGMTSTLVTSRIAAAVSRLHSPAVATQSGQTRGRAPYDKLDGEIETGANTIVAQLREQTLRSEFADAANRQMNRRKRREQMR